MRTQYALRNNQAERYQRLRLDSESHPLQVQPRPRTYPCLEQTMRERCTALAVGALLLITGCAKTVDTAAETQALLEADRAWAKHAAAGAVDSVLTYWTEDAVVVSPGQPTYSGKAAIRQMVTASMSIPGFRINWTPRKAVVSKSGDMGYTVGTNELTAPDPTGKLTTNKGRYLAVWRKDADGKWRCVEDYASNDGP